jgi:hypothetical protein
MISSTTGIFNSIIAYSYTDLLVLKFFPNLLVLKNFDFTMGSHFKGIIVSSYTDLLGISGFDGQDWYEVLGFA